MLGVLDGDFGLGGAEGIDGQLIRRFPEFGDAFVLR
jgi:hypothetical protein